MTRVVLRVRLVSGHQVDLEYDGIDAADDQSAVDHVVAELAQPDGVLRCRHGDRLVALFARGVATVEVAPRGAVL